MSQTRAERRQALLAEQQKVAPGTGVVAYLDRSAWAMTGSRTAGEWSWRGPLLGAGSMAVTAVLLVVLVNIDVSTMVIAAAVYVAFLVRGRYVHLRYLRDGGHAARGD
jgi:hypothetical protein